MTEQLRLVTTPWLRFSQYRVVETKLGRSILPAQGSELDSYDVWHDYERSKVNGTPRPYLALLKLLKDLHLPAITDHSGSTIDKFPYRYFRPLDEFAIEVNEHQEKLLVAWCANHGLLGVHQQRTIAMVMPPYLVHFERTALLIVQDSRTRMNGQFTLHSVVQGINKRSEIHAVNPAAEYWETPAVPAEVLESLQFSATDVRVQPSYKAAVKIPPRLRRVLDEPHALLVRCTPQEWDVSLARTPLEDVLRRDFPLIDPRTQPNFFHGRLIAPMINGRRIMQFLPWAPERIQVAPHLGENIQEFLFWGLMLYRAISHRDTTVLNSLTASVGCRTVLQSDEKLAIRWQCPSLISAYAQMAAQDFSSESRYIQCAECGSPAITDGYQTRFCSPQCGDRNRHKRWRRERKRSKKEAGSATTGNHSTES